MGRNGQPIDLLAARGKKHLTKAEITSRKKQESKLRSGVKTYKPSPQVENDMVALAMFKKLKKLYKSIDFVEGLDENIINRYCLLYSEYVQLRNMRQTITDKAVNSSIEERIFLSDKILEIDKRIEKKMDLLLKLEDRLFLNPTANVPAASLKPVEYPICP